jgi:hypothetical protein
MHGVGRGHPFASQNVVLRVDRVRFVRVVNARSITSNNMNDDLVATEYRPSPSAKARWIIAGIIDSVGKVGTRNIGNAHDFL